MLKSFNAFSVIFVLSALGVTFSRIHAEKPTTADYERHLQIMGSEVLKRIPPPFPASRLVYYREKEGRQADAISRPPCNIFFRWRNGTVSRWGMSFGGEDGAGLTTILRMLAGLYPQEIVGDDSLRNLNIPGDFVVNVDAPTESVVQRFEQILNEQMKVGIKLTFREKLSEVYVARGKYELTPLDKKRERVEIYGEKLNKDPSLGGGGSGDFDEFIEWVGMWIEQPVVSDGVAPPKEQLSWHYNLDSPFTEEERQRAKDPTLVLKHLSEQTGLTFTKEKRKVRLLFVERQ